VLQGRLTSRTICASLVRRRGASLMSPPGNPALLTGAAGVRPQLTALNESLLDPDCRLANGGLDDGLLSGLPPPSHQSRWARARRPACLAPSGAPHLPQQTE
jgi:hypothetical protein